MDTIRFARKVFAVTITGIAWNGETVTETVTVETHGDAEQARYVVQTQAFPARIRKVEQWEMVQVS